MKHVATLTSLALCTLLLVAPASAQTEISITPYAGYNTTAGYNVDFEEAEDEEDYEPPTRGGFIVGLGATFTLPYGNAVDLKLRPAVETAFVPGNQYSESIDGRDFEYTNSQRYLQFSGDLIAEFSGASPSIVPYAGGGITYMNYTYSQESTRPDFDGGTETESNSATGTTFGINVLGGARFLDVVDFGTPFAQIRATIGDPTPTSDGFDDQFPALETPISLMVGVSFDL